VTTGRTGRLPLALAILVPAAIAAALVFTFARPDPAHAPEQVANGNAAKLAAQAEQAPELRPIVLRGKRSVLGTGPSGPLAGGEGAGMPQRLAIPELHVNADIEPVGATADGIEVPAIGRAGWFESGPRPGDPGRAVIIGHIDGATAPGVFEHVPDIRSGAEIDVIDDEDGVHRYAVTGKTQVPKSHFPASAVYGASERPVLVLVTCGGTYDEGVGYSDNVIVFASAVS
jgi:hypothetical protein